MIDKEKAQKLIEKQDNQINKFWEFIYLSEVLWYYYIVTKKIEERSAIAHHLSIKVNDLIKIKDDKVIKTYKNLCYHEWGKKGYYNTMNEKIIVKNVKWVEPKLHPHIKYLIENIAGEKQENIEWIHKSILYKLTHINDPYMPALILYWKWGSWKWTLLHLLEMIFGRDNIQIGLGQRDLEWSFDSYQWWKLIVELILLLLIPLL